MNEWIKKSKAAYDAAQAIRAKAKAEGRDVTEEEFAAFERHMAEHKDCAAKAEAAQKREAALNAPAADLSHLNTSFADQVGNPGAMAAPPDTKIEMGDRVVLKDPKMGFESFDEFAFVCRKAAVDTRNGVPFKHDKFGAIATALEGVKAVSGAATFTGEEGGFLVPPEFSNEIYVRAAQVLPILAQCEKRTVRGNSTSLKALKDQDQATVGTRYGGIIVYWPNEGGEITASNLKTRKVQFTLNKMAALAISSDEELEDSVGYGDLLQGQIAYAMAEELTEAIMFGNGVGKPLGAFVSPACYSIPKETASGGQAADTIIMENINKMHAAIPSASRGRGAYYYNADCLPQLEQMSMTVGTGGVPVYLPAGGLVDKPHDRLKGRPAYETDHCLALGDAGDLVFGDFTDYVVVTKGAAVPKMAMSIHYKFATEETAWRATFRVDGRPKGETYQTPRKGSTYRSPWLKIAA